MQIILTSKEFDEAIALWLSAQGFTTDKYTIDTHIIAGRTNGSLGTRVEATLEPITNVSNQEIKTIDTNKVAPILRKFGQQDE